MVTLLGRQWRFTRTVIERNLRLNIIALMVSASDIGIKEDVMRLSIRVEENQVDRDGTITKEL